MLNGLIVHTTPTGNLPQTPELERPLHNRQKVGSQWCPSLRGSTLVTFRNFVACRQEQLRESRYPSDLTNCITLRRLYIGQIKHLLDTYYRTISNVKHWKHSKTGGEVLWTRLGLILHSANIITTAGTFFMHHSTGYGNVVSHVHLYLTHSHNCPIFDFL